MEVSSYPSMSATRLTLSGNCVRHYNMATKLNWSTGKMLHVKLKLHPQRGTVTSACNISDCAMPVCQVELTNVYPSYPLGLIWWHGLKSKKRRISTTHDKVPHYGLSQFTNGITLIRGGVKQCDLRLCKWWGKMCTIVANWAKEPYCRKLKP